MKPIRLLLAQKICRSLPPIIAQKIRTIVYPGDRAYADAYEFVVQAQTGSWFKGRTSEFHSYPFSVHGYYNWRNWAIVLSLCAPGDTIIEVGANIGTETAGFADIVGNEGCVYAFEPVPANLDILRKNAHLNKYRNVVILPVALSNTCDQVQFVLPPSNHMSGIGHVLLQDEKSSTETIEIKSVRLDSLAAAFGAVRVIFMDVEGAETSIIDGGWDFLSKNMPYIVLEASEKHLSRAGSSLIELHTKLEKLNYTVYNISRLTIHPVRFTETSKTMNWLCIPNTKAKIIRKRVNAYLWMCGLLPCIPGWNPLCKVG